MVLYKELIEKYKNRIKENENLARYHTFKVEGIADIVASPENEKELVDMISICKNNNYKFNVIGNGSNILFRDGIYKGVLITTRKLKSVEVEDNVLTCLCGAPMPFVANVALRNNLSGLEKLSGIPGTMGGAIIMNAGAYGSEIKDVLTSVTVLDRECNIKEISPEELDLSYRHSNVKEKGYIIIGCKLTLSHGKHEDIKFVIEECRAKRMSSQPYEYPNAGSIFKKEGEFFAGKLIDDCGLKGFSVGGAMVSHKHANFIVNKDKATYNDIIDLITYIQQTVYITNKVELHTEVEVI